MGQRRCRDAEDLAHGSGNQPNRTALAQVALAVRTRRSALIGRYEDILKVLKYSFTLPRNPSLLVTVAPPARTKMKSPRKVRFTSLTKFRLTRQERLMRSMGWERSASSACCKVLRAWKLSLPTRMMT